MNDAVHYLIHFEPPIEISSSIEELYHRISRQYENKYNSLISGVWRSHLMVYLSPLPIENHEAIMEAVEVMSKEFRPFQVTLGDFEKGSTGYIFVSIKEESKQPLINIRNHLIKKLVPLRDNTIKQKYLEKWNSFTEEEKERIHTTGLPYTYTPHLTVAKVEEDEVYPAIELIKESSLSGKSFEAKYLQVLTFHKGVNKIVGKYKLGS